jgi:hypothetical protein
VHHIEVIVQGPLENEGLLSVIDMAVLIDKLDFCSMVGEV